MYQEALKLLKQIAGDGIYYFDECVEVQTTNDPWSQVRVWGVEAKGRRIYIIDPVFGRFDLNPDHLADCVIADAIYNRLKELQTKAA